MTHLAEKLVHLAGLGEERFRSLRHSPAHHLPLTERGHQYGPRPCRHGRHPVQQAKAVKLRQDHVHNDQLRTFPLDDVPCVCAAADAAHYPEIPCGFDHPLQHHAKALVGVCQYDLHLVFHTLFSLFIL